MLAFEKNVILSDSEGDTQILRYFRPDRAAKYAGISRATLYNALSGGRLKSHRVGGCRLIDRLELDRFIAGHPAS